jgi:hypothetical protein
MRMDLISTTRASTVSAVLLLLVAGVAPLAVSLAESGSAEGQKAAPADAPLSSAQEAGGASMPQQQVVVDPATGKIVSRPVTPDQPRAVTGGEPITTVPPELSTSSEGLQVVPNPKTGGGVMVDLQGRFQQRTAVTLDAEGTPILHRSPAPAPASTQGAEDKGSGN